MGRKEVVFFLFVGFAILISLASFFSVYFFPDFFVSKTITGNVIGTVALYVSGGSKTVTIHLPLNQTYPAPIGEDYIFNLTVSSDFPLDSPETWKYALYDIRHSTWGLNTTFVPNTTEITANRWGNRLAVYAKDDEENWQGGEVIFYVETPNSAPIIEDIDDEFFVCELDKNELFYFNGSDVDEEGEELVAYFDNDAFRADSTAINLTDRRFEFKANDQLGKDDVAVYEDIQVFLSDGEVNDTYDFGARSDVFNLTVIEVNNFPEEENIATQTIYLQGDNTTFYKQWNVTDVETSYGGSLSYNITFGGQANAFNISSTGIMNFTPIAEGQYPNIMVCVNDSGLALGSIHENFSICSDKGRSSGSLSKCDNFSLTVTNDSRAPTILNYSPSNLSFEMEGSATTLFNVFVYDADGTIPDISWYVDDVLKEFNEGVSNDSFGYTFGYDVGGYHNVTMIVSDGLESTPLSWNVSVNLVAAPSGGDGGGGGGGGGSSLSGECREKWVCNNWGVCQNVKRSFDAKTLSPEDYSDFKEKCAQNSYDDRFCGFQITSCRDLALCNNSVSLIPRPIEAQVCYFTENPNCIDGITNCHDGSCELLVDCGGPCSPCPTCYDNKRNQGEANVDCGGPCPWSCEAELPFNLTRWVVILLLILLLVIVIFIAIKVFGLVRYRRSKHRR
jgi:hypothetical protein